VPWKFKGSHEMSANFKPGWPGGRSPATRVLHAAPTISHFPPLCNPNLITPPTGPHPGGVEGQIPRGYSVLVRVAAAHRTCPPTHDPLQRRSVNVNLQLAGQIRAVPSGRSDLKLSSARPMAERSACLQSGLQALGSWQLDDQPRSRDRRRGRQPTTVPADDLGGDPQPEAASALVSPIPNELRDRFR
jgi:hypothetical protein